MPQRSRNFYNSKVVPILKPSLGLVGKKLQKKEERFLRLALKEYNIVSIDDVENGKRCNCICPECFSPLVAKNKGKIKTHHFAHALESVCSGGIESALHLLAKDLLLKTKQIFIPDFKYYFEEFRVEKVLIKSNRVFTFETVKLEEKISIENETIIVDALCITDNKQLIIEFAKTHFIDEAKKEKLKKLGIACLEIPISSGEQERKEFLKQLQSFFFKSNWIVNRKGENEIESLKVKLLEKSEMKKQRDNLEREKIEQTKKDKHRRKRIIEENLKEQNKFKKEKDLSDAAEKGNLYLKCPIKKELSKAIYNKIYHSHPIMPKLFLAKEVSVIYDRSPKFIDIFIDKERVILRPPEYARLQKNEMHDYDEIYDAVQKFIDFRDNQKFSTCNYCKMFISNVHEYIVCKYGSTADIGISEFLI